MFCIYSSYSNYLLFVSCLKNNASIGKKLVEYASFLNVRDKGGKFKKFQS